METATDTKSKITLFDRANSQLQNTVFQHSHHHELSTFASGEQEPACRTCNHLTCRGDNIRSVKVLWNRESPLVYLPFFFFPEELFWFLTIPSSSEFFNLYFFFKMTAPESGRCLPSSAVTCFGTFLNQQRQVIRQRVGVHTATYSVSKSVHSFLNSLWISK